MDLRTTKKEGAHVWHGKAAPLTMQERQRTLEEDQVLSPTTSMSINHSISTAVWSPTSILTGSLVLNPSSKKLPFSVEGAHYRNTQLVEMQRTTGHRVSIPSWYIYNTAPTLKAERTSQKRRQEGFKKPVDQDTRYFISSGHEREDTLMKSQQCGNNMAEQGQHQLTCQHEWRKSYKAHPRWRATGS